MPPFDPSPFPADYAWIAVDAKSQLAAFITAGEGQVPYEVFEQDVIPPYAIEHEILEMPVVSGVILNIYSKACKKLGQWVALRCFSRSSGAARQNRSKNCRRLRRQFLRL